MRRIRAIPSNFEAFFFPLVPFFLRSTFSTNNFNEREKAPHTPTHTPHNPRTPWESRARCCERAKGARPGTRSAAWCITSEPSSQIQLASLTTVGKRQTINVSRWHRVGHGGRYYQTAVPPTLSFPSRPLPNEITRTRRGRNPSRAPKLKKNYLLGTHAALFSSA